MTKYPGRFKDGGKHARKYFEMDDRQLQLEHD